MSRTNETRNIGWYKTCWWKCRLIPSVGNDKPGLNKEKCRCECKILVDKSIRDKGFIWNSSNCEWECDKLCGIGDY